MVGRWLAVATLMGTTVTEEKENKFYFYLVSFTFRTHKKTTNGQIETHGLW